MKGALVLIAAAVIVAAGALALERADDPPGPSGIAPEQWVPIGDRLGLVVTSPASPGGSLQGRLMTRIGGRWVPVELVETGVRVLPAR